MLTGEAETRITPKTFITFKCSSCGKRGRFLIAGGLTCPHCGKIYTFRCLACGYEFNLGEYAEYCVSCGWLKCPKCGSCGCLIKEVIHFLKNIRRLWRREKAFKVFGLMSREVIKVEKLKVRHIISIVKLDDGRKRKKRRE